MSLPLPCPVEDESDEDVGTWSLPPGVESDSDEAPAAVTSASSAGQRRPQQKRKRDEQRTQACCKTPRPAYGHAVMEVFSQPRVVPAAAERGLLAVHSLDKDSRPSWDCNLQSDRERAAALIDSCKPYLLVLSPECRMYSIMQNLNLHRRDPASVAVQQLEADQHMDFCALLMRQQARHGRKFLLEQPSSASSWQLAALRSVMDSVPNTVLISFPQCRFGLKRVLVSASAAASGCNEGTVRRRAPKVDAAASRGHARVWAGQGSMRQCDTCTEVADSVGAGLSQSGFVCAACTLSLLPAAVWAQAGLLG